MSYSRFGIAYVSILLDGMPAGATLHNTLDKQFKDWPRPEGLSFWSWELFSKTLEPDGRSHRLQIQVRWGRKAKPSQPFRFSSDGMHWMSFHLEEGRVLLSVADLEDIPAEFQEDGISYMVPAGCPSRRFFFGMSYVEGLGKSQADFPTLVVNPSRVIEEVVDARQFRLIGGNRRFGNGYFKADDGHTVYYAFYGFPNRNDDYFYNAEISHEEFYEIESRYDCVFSGDDRGEGFYEKYIQNHNILLKGENRLL